MKFSRFPVCLFGKCATDFVKVIPMRDTHDEFDFMPLDATPLTEFGRTGQTPAQCSIRFGPQFTEKDLQAIAEQVVIEPRTGDSRILQGDISGVMKFDPHPLEILARNFIEREFQKWWEPNGRRMYHLLLVATENFTIETKMRSIFFSIFEESFSPWPNVIVNDDKTEYSVPSGHHVRDDPDYGEMIVKN